MRRARNRRSELARRRAIPGVRGRAACVYPIGLTLACCSPAALHGRGAAPRTRPRASTAWRRSSAAARRCRASMRCCISDVELRARIAWCGAHPEAELLSPLPNAVLQAALNEVIGELLIAREAVRVRAESPASGEVEREHARLVASAGGAGTHARAARGARRTGDELDAIARRRALVGAFLSANLQGVTVVTDSEVERALDAEADALRRARPCQCAERAARAHVAQGARAERSSAGSRCCARARRCACTCNTEPSGARRPWWPRSRAARDDFAGAAGRLAGGLPHRTGFVSGAVADRGAAQGAEAAVFGAARAASRTAQRRSPRS